MTKGRKEQDKRTKVTEKRKIIIRKRKGVRKRGEKARGKRYNGQRHEHKASKEKR